MNKVNREIVDYLELVIISQYKFFDKAHDENHVHKVIENSFSLAKNFSVNINMVYVIAAYHDIGLINGRRNHEKTSAQFLLSDSNLLNWFSEKELICMAEAVEDHRASNNYIPRSIYGEIVAEADRDIEYYTILTRTLLYSLEKYPMYSFEQHFDRTIEHLYDKYGENGYLKLYLDFGRNKENLEELRKNMKSREKIFDDFKKIFCSYMD